MIDLLDSPARNSVMSFRLIQSNQKHKAAVLLFIFFILFFLIGKIEIEKKLIVSEEKKIFYNMRYLSCRGTTCNPVICVLIASIYRANEYFLAKCLPKSFFQLAFKNASDKARLWCTMKIQHKDTLMEHI